MLFFPLPTWQSNHAADRTSRMGSSLWFNWFRTMVRLVRVERGRDHRGRNQIESKITRSGSSNRGREGRRREGMREFHFRFLPAIKIARGALLAHCTQRASGLTGRHELRRPRTSIPPFCAAFGLTACGVVDLTVRQLGF